MATVTQPVISHNVHGTVEIVAPALALTPRSLAGAAPGKVIHAKIQMPAKMQGVAKAVWACAERFPQAME